jgi:hypothetical protein
MTHFSAVVRGDQQRMAGEGAPFQEMMKRNALWPLMEELN